MMGENERKFCEVEISTMNEIIVEGVICIFSFVLIASAVCKYCTLRATRNSHVTKVYAMIVAWWITFVAGSVYNIIIYLIYKDSQIEQNEQLGTLTKYGFIISWINAYFIQCLLLYLPYQWGKMITTLFSNIERQSGVVMENNQEYNGIERHMYCILKFYIYIRCFFLALPVIAIWLTGTYQLVVIKIMVPCLLLDCVFITLSLLVGMYSLKSSKEIKDQIDEQEAKRTFNQYLMIIVANTVRFVFDIFFVYQLVFKQSFLQTYCIFEEDDEVGSIIKNILTVILSHFLPIFIILRIYTLEEEPEEMGKSLLITVSDPSSSI